MALPTSRNTSYAPTDPVKSADLNDLQDQIIALFGGAHGDRERILPPAAASPASSGTVGTAFNDLVSGQFDYAIDLEVGQRLKAVEVDIRTNAGGDTITLDLRKSASSPGDSSVSSVIATASVTDTSLLTVSGLSELIDGTAMYWIEIGGADGDFKAVRVKYDRP